MTQNTPMMVTLSISKLIATSAPRNRVKSACNTLNTLILMVLLSIIAIPSGYTQDAKAIALPEIPKGEANPYLQSPFTVPSQLQMANYRKMYRKVSAIDFSALHWNHFVSIFVTQGGAKPYRKNFLEYLTVIEMEEEDEEYDPTFMHYPVGTIFVKEHFISKDGKPGPATQLSIMKKHEPGYDKAGGDWEYIQLTADGNVVVQGHSQDPVVDSMCAQCHSNIADRDYIFSLNYKDTSTDE